MQYKGYLAGALCLVGFVYFAGCDTPGSIDTQDGSIAWDPARRAFDCAAANAFLKSSYRKGWEIEGLS